MAAPLPRPVAPAGQPPMPQRPRAQRAWLQGIQGLLLGLLLLLAPVGPAAWAAQASPTQANAVQPSQGGDRQGPARAAGVVCAPIDQAGVAALFDRWNAALASRDPEQVAALYGDDALLLPTLSPIPRADHAAIADYFVQFLAQAPEGRIESRTVRLGCNEALDAGTYSFLLHPKGQKPRRVAARYSFVYVFDGQDWRIQHHHSSLMPAPAD